ncbi:MAG TPA: hypothetical protein VMO88_12695 [Acidimicrobiales bacterium]|jgi:prophage regulatory protein|nr:hypothetical protein [Acidimicrobiales bacterium]
MSQELIAATYSTLGSHSPERIESAARAGQRPSALKTSGMSTNWEGGSAVEREIVSARELEQLTGTKASTWRYWASIGQGPPSFKLGRRRVWKKSSVLTWLAEQETATLGREG